MPAMASPGHESESKQVLDAQLRATLEVIPAYTWRADPSGALTFVNKRHADYLGLPKDHPLRFGIATGEAWDSHLAFVHPDDHEEARRIWSTCLRTSCAGEFTFRVRNAEGVHRWFTTRAEPLRASDGALLYWIGVNIEIDEFKQAQFYLSEGQRLAHMGSWAFDAKGFSYWSSELFHVYGLDTRDEPPSVEEYLAHVHPEDRDFMKQGIARMLNDHLPFDFTKRIVRPDGEIRHVRCVGVPVTHGAIFHGFLGTGMDVTEQQLLTEELERQQAHLTEAQRLTHTGSWTWRLPNRALDLSEEWYRIYGFDPADGAPTLEDWSQRVHPEDRLMWNRAVERATLDEADYDHEFRILLPNGIVKWIHAVGHPVPSDAGGLKQFFGSSTDITERKRAEEELRRSEVELRQMLDLAPQHIAVYGPNREPLYANRILLDYYGVTLEAWQRRHDRGEVVHPDEWERVNRQFDRALASGVAFESEMRVRKSDGSYRWFLARFNSLRDEHGQITRWYVAATDIEDRKQAEDRLRSENVALREEIDKASMFEEIVGTSPALKAVLSRVSKVAPTGSTVLITGETGTGKELVARAIHRMSNRTSHGFVSVNCAAIPRDLIASELFGHEKGSFTGATQQRLGRFELANGGTLFLDEVGELPAETQIALLRVLQEHEFERVGGTRRIRTDVRVIAATNRDLPAAIISGSFRSDLFYRLNVFPIEIPSLRERREDIPLLVEYFIDRYARKAGKPIATVEKRTLEVLQSYPWPGNIRELQNVIERSIIVCETENFSVDESWLSQRLPERNAESHIYLSEKVAAQEREVIQSALRQCQGRVYGPSGAAVKLGIARSTLESKIRSLNINKNLFRV
jgi:PAS domain S-box-containing protein